MLSRNFAPFASRGGFSIFQNGFFSKSPAKKSIKEIRRENIQRPHAWAFLLISHV
jgi:hypothetical protein